MNTTVLQVVLGSGIISAIVTAYVSLRRLPREKQSAAITDQATANESLARLNERLEAENTRLEEDRDYWRTRAISREAEVLRRYGHQMPENQPHE